MILHTESKKGWLILLAFSLFCPGKSFFSRPLVVGSSNPSFVQNGVIRSVAENEAATPSSSTSSDEPKKCMYLPSTEEGWKERTNLNDLKVGQPLTGKLVQQLLDGRTGPKLYFDCGICRIDSKGKFQIVNGMLRFYKRGTKKSVVKKKAAKLNKRQQVELVVSRVSVPSAQFEVCLSKEDAELYAEQHPKRRRVSELQVDEELVGTVTRVMPYGVMVDVGASRTGLLHINKVADLYGHYIDKETGLERSGLERGAKIRVAVHRNEKKRLELDFTADVKLQAEKEQEKEKSEKKTTGISDATNQDPYDITEEEAAAWAAYAEMDTEEDTGDGGFDEYDEDREIEDAFGLGGF